MDGMSSADSYKLWADMRDVLYQVVSAIDIWTETGLVKTK